MGCGASSPVVDEEARRRYVRNVCKNHPRLITRYHSNDMIEAQLKQDRQQSKCVSRFARRHGLRGKLVAEQHEILAGKRSRCCCWAQAVRNNFVYMRLAC